MPRTLGPPARRAPAAAFYAAPSGPSMAAAAAGAASMSRIRGWCPQAAMNFSRSAAEIAVVMSLVSGWQLTGSWRSRPASSTTCHPVRGVVDQAEGRDRAGQHAQVRHQPLGAAEGEAPAAEPLAQPFEVDRPVLQRHDQPHRVALLVAQEEVLDVRAGQLAAQRLGLLHREDRRMADRAVRDPERLEPRQQRGGRGGLCRRRRGTCGAGFAVAHGPGFAVAHGPGSLSLMGWASLSLTGRVRCRSRAGDHSRARRESQSPTGATALPSDTIPQRACESFLTRGAGEGHHAKHGGGGHSPRTILAQNPHHRSSGGVPASRVRRKRGLQARKSEPATAPPKSLACKLGFRR